MVEHYLDTVGVRGSKPLPRTIFLFVQKLLLSFSLLFIGTYIGQAQQALPDASQIILNTREGPLYHMVTYAPAPVLPPAAIEQHLSGRGVYVVDIVNGIVEDVRILRSAGHKILDDAALTTLPTWHFRPHRILKATIVIDFGLLIQQSRIRLRK